MRDVRTDVLVVGGGLGGVAAALTAARLGYQVTLTEQTPWLGGQLTSQAVPPDENPWIESASISPSYRALRWRIREYYRRNHPLTEAAAADPLLNPGSGFVSPLCHEPPVAVAAIDELVAPYVGSGRLTVLRQHTPVSVLVTGDRLDAVTLRRADGTQLTIAARYIVDATELGDLLDLGGVEHVLGAESAEQTGEPHAVAEADPLDQQAISWCFAVEYRPGENHTIERPADYEHWLTHHDPFWPGPQLSWTDVDPVTLERRTRPIFTGDPDDAGLRDLWHYRRIVARTQHRGLVEHDVTMVNWPQIDYWEAPIIGVPAADRDRALRRCRGLSESFLYWMQTAAGRLDGGTGYPELRLRGDLMGSDDGLAISPYIREARRIRSEFTVLEQHVGVTARPDGAGSELFDDSVGIGNYRIDLHPSTGNRTYVDIDCYPFQIPLGALLPVRVENLIPANKNIGTTHITNGAYRLHPVEWAIGEAVGALAAFCLTTGEHPRGIRASTERLTDYQRLLSGPLGIGLAWPDHIRRTPCSQRPPHPQLVADTIDYRPGEILSPLS